MFSSHATPAKHWRALAKEALAIADLLETVRLADIGFGSLVEE